MTSSRRVVFRWLVRGAGVAVMAVGIAGPTPGYVGSCDPSGSTPAVDPEAWCTEREGVECARDLAANRINQSMYSACQAQVPTTCRGFNFPPGCSPSRELAAQCIDDLSRTDLLSTPSDAMPSCQSNALCGAATLVSDPEGI
ncbi:MAG: hypothetical protein U0234_03260 [Sandaracinus sp.]